MIGTVLQLRYHKISDLWDSRSPKRRGWCNGTGLLYPRFLFLRFRGITPRLDGLLRRTRSAAQENIWSAIFLNEAFNSLKRSLAEMVFQAMNVV